jgi:hypothetical protein
MSPDGMGMGMPFATRTPNGNGEMGGTTKEEGQVRDPVTGELFAESEVHKVYIT